MKRFILVQIFIISYVFYTTTNFILEIAKLNYYQSFPFLAAVSGYSQFFLTVSLFILLLRSPFQNYILKRIIQLLAIYYLLLSPLVTVVIHLKLVEQIHIFDYAMTLIDFSLLNEKAPHFIINLKVLSFAELAAMIIFLILLKRIGYLRLIDFVFIVYLPNKKIFKGWVTVFFILIFFYLYYSFIATYTLFEGIKGVSKNYLKVDENFNLYSVRTTFTKKEKNKTVKVYLVPMQHIGEENFYREALNFKTRGSTIVLNEGVKVPKESKLKETLNYGKIARNLGLVAQSTNLVKNTPSSWKHQNADVSISHFNPRTLNHLDKFIGDNSLGLYDLDLDEQEYIVLLEEIKKDIIDLREKHLIKIMENIIFGAEQKYQNLIIPWGALHMYPLQQVLEEWGFTISDRKKIKIMNFKNLLGNYINNLNKVANKTEEKNTL